MNTMDPYDNLMRNLRISVDSCMKGKVNLVTVDSKVDYALQVNRVRRHIDAGKVVHSIAL